MGPEDCRDGIPDADPSERDACFAEKAKPTFFSADLVREQPPTACATNFEPLAYLPLKNQGADMQLRCLVLKMSSWTVRQALSQKPTLLPALGNAGVTRKTQKSPPRINRIRSEDRVFSLTLS
jgi:hypothetical protein